MVTRARTAPLRKVCLFSLYVISNVGIWRSGTIYWQTNIIVDINGLDGDEKGNFTATMWRRATTPLHSKIMTIPL
ncbi:hypothetical protein BD779DRAFT_1538978 [Infundibulicybe gibba]|nr:hypothetical protein BD779DRAFT_1538978 [Infundibulicybe gibba]